MEQDFGKSTKLDKPYSLVRVGFVTHLIHKRRLAEVEVHVQGVGIRHGAHSNFKEAARQALCGQEAATGNQI